ncbi:pikachurin-like [Plakobranchus ocellatus]|uniref:Pikachurin-like n=1 Tax=Plakobranchus ocellatus TaxID=259542 RepID=A0AAV4CHL2_9GAST|nr:pikachurin-like [Plakobranchus ocellatus]
MYIAQTILCPYGLVFIVGAAFISFFIWSIRNDNFKTSLNGIHLFALKTCCSVLIFPYLFRAIEVKLHSFLISIDSPVEVPHFSFNSSLEIPMPSRKYHHTKLRLIMKASSPDGLILYLGHSLPSGRGFFSLALKDGYAVFTIVTGRRIVQIKSPDRLNPNKWTLVLATHIGDSGYIKVSDQVVIHFSGLENNTNINYTRLNLKENSFYLGRDPRNDGSKLDETNRRSFTGCLQLVAINDEIIPLSGPKVSGINIFNCSVCEKLNEPCLNGGQCIPGKDSSYTCGSSKRLSNIQCKDVQGLRFTGKNFVRYKDKEILDKLVGERTDVHLEIRTTCPNGLIFWSGNMHKKTSESTSVVRDFLALGLESGVLRLYYDLGAGEAQANYTKTRLFDGNWHFIKIIR